MRAGPVFVTGGTGYLGRALIDALLARDYPVFALVRPGSEERLPNQSVRVTGDALNAASFAAAVSGFHWYALWKLTTSAAGTKPLSLLSTNPASARNGNAEETLNRPLANGGPASPAACPRALASAAAPPNWSGRMTS